MKQVPHQFRVDAAIGLEKDVVDVQPEDFFTVRQPAGEFARTTTGLNTLGRRIKGWRTDALLIITAARKDPQHQDLCPWVTFPDRSHDRLGAGEDLLSGVDFLEMTIVGIVGADQEHDHFGRSLEVEFTILQVPENLFGPITVVPEVDGVEGGEVSVPDVLHRLVLATQFTDCVSDRVADENHVITPVSGRLHFLIVPGTGRRAGKVRITGFRHPAFRLNLGTRGGNVQEQRQECGGKNQLVCGWHQNRPSHDGIC